MQLVGTPKGCPQGGGDCDDSNPKRYKGAKELCNGIVTGTPKQPKSGEFGPTAKPSPLGSGVATLRPFDLKPSLALGCLTQAKGLALDFNDLADMG